MHTIKMNVIALILDDNRRRGKTLNDNKNNTF